MHHINKEDHPPTPIRGTKMEEGLDVLTPKSEDLLVNTKFGKFPDLYAPLFWGLAPLSTQPQLRPCDSFIDYGCRVDG